MPASGGKWLAPGFRLGGCLLQRTVARSLRIATFRSLKWTGKNWKATRRLEYKRVRIIGRKVKGYRLGVRDRCAHPGGRTAAGSARVSQRQPGRGVPDVRLRGKEAATG